MPTRRLSSPSIACRLIALTSLLVFGWATHGSAAPSDSVVVFNEIMYHPRAPTDSEWIELYNQMAVDVDLGAWKLTGGIEFSFPEGTVLPGGGFLVVAANPTTVAGSLGPFTGRLDNGGETIELRNNSDRLMDSIRYDDTWPWPPAADGGGASLVKISPLVATGETRNWRASLARGGTPGSTEDFSLGIAVHFSEIAAGGNPSFFVELYNADDRDLDLAGCQIASSNGTDVYTLPSQILNAGERTSVYAATLGFTPQVGQRLFLLNAGATRVLDGAGITGSLQARRTADSARNRFFAPNGPTSGLPSTFSFHDGIVINEIMYHARPSYPVEGIPATYVEEVILPGDAIWKYNQSGVFPGSDWTTAAFDDTGWPSGPAALGVESAPLPETIRTNLTLGEVTYYFRTSLNYAGDPATDLLRLRLLIDDGVVVHINGAPAMQWGFQDGEVIDHGTFASSTVDNAAYMSFDIPENMLVPGPNLIAVEVHQSSAGSTDIVFGMEVISRTETDPGVPAAPFTTSKEEWIELYNRSGAPVNLGGWRLAEAVDFTFPPGTTIAEDGYLVIAGDLPAFNAAHPGVFAIGEYSGGLGNASDHIVLVDDLGNPADEVRYFDGGRWDGEADGYGPSLELVSPHADNARGEAWRASDEAARSTWRTYRYRAIASTPVPGAPIFWKEFALGMLHGSGEILIDDLSVVEDPDGRAIERLQNGSFDRGSTAAWRLMGNHQRSFVEDDGTGNDILHLVASGATEYQGNQLETTFARRAAIANGQEYQISFRARWLSGSSHLNTRLYFNRASATTELDVPGGNGTPGAQNSRYLPNSGPTFDRLRHAPVLPRNGQPVTVSTHPIDSDGIAAVTLHYRPDGGSWSAVAMTANPAGIYSAGIPGQSPGTVMQFYVEATDQLGAATTLPIEGPDSRALYEINEGVTGGNEVHDLRAIMLTADSDHLHDPFNTLSNELLGATVFYQGEAFYDVGIRLKGSFVGRDAARVGFNLNFNPDQLFRGIHGKVAVDRSTHGDLGVDEIIIKHVATRAGGIPAMYDDLVQFIAPRSEHNLRSSIRMAGFDDIYLDSQFDQGSDGTVYEFEVYRWATTTVDGTPEGIKRAGGKNYPNSWRNVAVQGFGNEKEDYRWHCLITTNRRQDAYQDVIPFLQTMGLGATALEAEAPNVMDVDAVLRTIAYQSLVGPADCTYTGGADHNFRLYARPDGKVMYMPWDWDSAFQRPTSASLVGGGNWAKLVNRPANLRRYYGHLKDIIEKAFNSTYMAYWTAHYGALANQNFSGRLGYISSRAAYVLGQLPAPVPFAIATNGGRDFSISASSVTIQGNGWIDVSEIRAVANGHPLEVSWPDADSWSLTMPISPGPNPVTLTAYDRSGSEVGRDSITVTNSGTVEPGNETNLAISEIMHHPVAGGVEFLEVMNVGAAQVDLTNVQFSEGVEFSFAPNTILDPGDRIVVTENPTNFQSIYGTGIAIAGAFENETNLRNSGERITLRDGTGKIIHQFTYGDRLPWPVDPDGRGPSLVLINPRSNPEPSMAWNWRSSLLAGGNPGTSDATSFSGVAGIDSDGNGTDDLLDYAIGHAAGASDGLPWIIRDGDSITFAYMRRITADDVTLSAQWSIDLVNWNEPGPEFELVVRAHGGPGRELVVYRSAPAQFAAGARMFVRLTGSLFPPSN